VQAGYRILEVPISYTPRKAKKLSPFKDGWPALAMLLRRRFVKRFKYNEKAPTSVEAKQATSVQK
jgi:dolichol-phosphate mannosyltransferase